LKTGAVVILYKPSLATTQALIDSILVQTDVVSIIDNSPNPANLLLDKHNLNYHHFPGNIGIAAAQNTGLKDLMLSGCEFGLLLDQDSSVSDSFVSSLASLLENSNYNERDIVAIGPRILCSFSDKIVKPRVQKELTIYNDMVCVSQIISSGMMINLNILERIGFKDESLFIDGVDHEWCWRAGGSNFQVAIANDIEMTHTLGDSRSRFAGLTYKVGAPIRLYYQFRNILLLTRREYVPNYWKCRNLLVLPIRFFANTLLQDNKRLRLKYMLHGLWDGILGRTGAYHSNH
jgi:rhamnosyltransferase